MEISEFNAIVLKYFDEIKKDTYLIRRMNGMAKKLDRRF